MRLERRTIVFTFLVFISLTVVAGISVSLGLFPNADPLFGRYVWGLVGGEIVVAVVGILRGRPGTTDMLVNIRFPQTVELDEKKCTYEIMSKDGGIKSQGSTVPTLGPGGYNCRLSSDVNPSDYVKLNLLEKNGTQWEVSYFTPYITNQTAKLVVSEEHTYDDSL